MVCCIKPRDFQALPNGAQVKIFMLLNEALNEKEYGLGIRIRISWSGPDCFEAPVSTMWGAQKSLLTGRYHSIIKFKQMAHKKNNTWKRQKSKTKRNKIQENQIKAMKYTYF